MSVLLWSLLANVAAFAVYAIERSIVVTGGAVALEGLAATFMKSLNGANGGQREAR